MPTTVTASNSVVYHLFQLSEYTCPGTEDVMEFATIDNDLLDGYRAGILAGFTSGTRSWKLTMPTLASLDEAVVTAEGARGGTMTRDLYLRTLYAENKASGQPFVFLSPQDGEYYFVDFVDEALTMQRMRVKIFSTGLTMRQRRIAGVTLP